MGRGFSLNYVWVLALGLGSLFANTLFSEIKTLSAKKEPVVSNIRGLGAPIAFARFALQEKGSKNKANLSQNFGSNCRESEIFGRAVAKQDFCAPMPFRIISGEKRDPAPWLVQSLPQKFYWEQTIPNGYKLSVELQSADSMPFPSVIKYPASATNRHLIIISPSKKLQRNRPYYLLARLTKLLGADKKAKSAKSEVWILPLQISS